MYLLKLVPTVLEMSENAGKHERGCFVKRLSGNIARSSFASNTAKRY